MVPPRTRWEGRASDVVAQCPIRAVCFGAFTCSDQSRRAGVPSPNQVRFRKGDLVYYDQIEGQSLVIIQSGIAALVNYLPDGETLITEVIGPGMALGLTAAMSGRRHPLVVTALTELTGCIAYSPRLVNWIDGEPTLRRPALRLIDEAFQAIFRQQWTMNAHHMRERLRRQLLVVANLVEPAGVDVVVPLTQSDLAFLIGTTHGTVSEYLRELGEEGVVRAGYGKVTVLGSCALDPAMMNFTITPLNLNSLASLEP